MAHPKHRISKQRKRTRRTHYKASEPTLSTCKETGVVHQRHRAYVVEGDVYYRGKLLIEKKQAVK